MYGLNSYSRAPYAAFNTVYIGSVTENIISETDSEAVIASFVAAITEAITISNVNGFSLAALITENLNLTETKTVIASFNSIINESFSISDVPFGGGWFVINDNQTITWVSLNDSQTPNWTQINNSQ